MADRYSTKDQLEALMWRATMAAFGLDPETEVNSSRVRREWPKDGAPVWDIDDSVALLRVTEQPGPYSDQHDVTHTNDGDAMNTEVGYTRELECFWSFYGPTAYDDARTVADLLFRYELRILLAIDEVYIIPDRCIPRRVPEPVAGRWWERADLSIRFYAYTTKNFATQPIAEATVTVTHEDGTTTTDTVR